MGATILEKVLARRAGLDRVEVGDIVTVDVDRAVLTDPNLRFHAGWRWPREIWDPSRVVMVADHLVMGSTPENARSLRIARAAARYYGIENTHFAGQDQGISNQVIADRAYALPGTVLVNSDSHTLGAGALNCAARGIGRMELISVLCTGKTWHRVSPTVRYELHGELRDGVSAKDVFLYLAGRWGSHEGQAIEFGGPGQAGLTVNARRTLSTMCAEVSADFALWAADEVLTDYLDERTSEPYEPVDPDPDADYLDIREIELSSLVPQVSGTDTVVRNTMSLEDFPTDVRLDQCVVGSCANGTLEDLREVARVLDGQQVAPWVRFIVTPGSMEIYRAASKLGYLEKIAAAGAVVTPSACGACAGWDFGALAPGEVCLTSTTRNFKGRMGSSAARIHLASPRTVAASAVAGYVVDPAGLSAADTVAT